MKAKPTMTRAKLAKEARRKPKQYGKSITIQAVHSITPSGHHAWVQTKRGLVRKEIKNIPKRLLEAYHAR